MTDVLREAMTLWFKERFAELVKVNPDQIDGNEPFDIYGITSLDIVYVIASGMKHFRIKIARTDLADVNSINGVVDVFDRNAASTA